MPLLAGPPPFHWEKLERRAHIDFFTVHAPMRQPLPALTGKPFWFRPPGSNGHSLTIHDPTLDDIQALISALGDLKLMALEVAVDLFPMHSLEDAAREQLLLDTFKAVAGRFRPEDATEWGYGKRGGVTTVGEPLKPFHRRFPSPHEQLIYGHRGDFMQAKAYLKRVDQGRRLAAAQQRVRMEVALKAGGLMVDTFNLRTMQDLIGYSYRKVFANHFRIIERPEVRRRKNLSSQTATKLEAKMVRAWATAGVGKFAPEVADLPPETSASARRQILSRASQQLARKDFVLRRDQVSNGRIGSALQQLQRRMTP